MPQISSWAEEKIAVQKERLRDVQEALRNGGPQGSDPLTPASVSPYPGDHRSSLPLDAQGFQLWGPTQGFSYPLFLFSLSMLSYAASFSMLANRMGSFIRATSD